MVRVPVRTPVAAGVKLIAMEQLAPTASVVPQLLVSANSAVVEIPLNVTDDVPEFVTTRTLFCLYRLSPGCRR